MATPILQTKLFVPGSHLRGGRITHVRRERLLRRLNSGLSTRLITVCAPAGFGKSSLLSEWLWRGTAAATEIVQAADAQTTPHRAAWLSLDEGDNDAARFWTYFVAALQSVDAGIGAATTTLLQSPQLLPAETLLTPVLNDLTDYPDHIVLVLDDYHAIHTPAIHKGLLFLLDHLPPKVHLVVSSRSDPPWPLARWRGQNQLTELRADDLRFTPEEAALFLKEIMGLALSAQEIRALESRTEGWIAGLQLVGLSLQGIGDVSGFVAAFSGSNRYIVDYLVEEVLSRQPEAVHQFLMQTSILERLCGPLCDAVTGGNLGDGQQTLEELEHAHLFLIPLDAERRWYRYHHLFAEVLRHRLRLGHAAEIPALHTRASLWYEQSAEYEAAVAHALAVPDVGRAADLVERVAIAILLQRSEIFVARNLLKQVPIAMIHARPQLALAYAIMLLLFSRLDDLAQLMRDSAPALTAPNVPADIVGGFMMLDATTARFHGDYERAFTLSRLALAQLPADAGIFRAAALLNIGTSHLRRGEYAAGHRTLAETFTISVSGGAHYLALAAVEEIASDQAKRGMLNRTKQTAEEAIVLIARSGWTRMPASGLVYICLGEVLCEWNDLDGAIRALAHGIPLLRGTTETRLLARGDIALARALRAKGEPESALRTLRQGDEWFTQAQIAAQDARAWLAAYRARLESRLGSLEPALQWAETVDTSWVDGVRVDAIEKNETGAVERFTLARLRIAQYRHERQNSLLDEAAHMLYELLAAAEAVGWMSQVIEGCMLQALVLHARGDQRSAHSSILRALTLAEPDSFVRIFVDEGAPMHTLLRETRRSLERLPVGQQPPRIAVYIDRLLAALEAELFGELASPSAEHPRAQALVEPLTERELEILQLVNDGLSNSEMAARLIVSVGTVKKHLNNIFGKLGVGSRTQALVRARTLHLF